MNSAKDFFDENGFVYGISYKPGDRFSGQFHIFYDWEEAQKWLETEQYDFRERELCSEQTVRDDYEWLNTLDDEDSTILDCF